MEQNKTKKGFTLIEMLVVIGIIGLLTTVGLVSFSAARKSAITKRRVANLENVRGAFSMYYSAKSSWPAVAGWDDLITTKLSGYISDSIPANEDADAGNGNEYYVCGCNTGDAPNCGAICSSGAQMKVCARCEGITEECNDTTEYDSNSPGSKWACLTVK